MTHDITKLDKIPADSPQWRFLLTGFGVPFDRTDLIVEIATAPTLDGVVSKLGMELNNQGEINDAEFAIVPHLIERILNLRVWDFLAITVILDIELLRQEGQSAAEHVLTDYLTALDVFFRAIDTLRPHELAKRDLVLCDALHSAAAGRTAEARGFFEICVRMNE